MKIGIDARFFGPRVGGGGLGRYVSELVTHLQKIDQRNQYILFLKKENFHECKITNKNFSKQLIDIPWYSIEEQRKMPGIIARSKIDFMHYPHWNIPVFSKVPFVVTIHDLIMLELPHSSHASTRHPLVYGFKHAGFRIVLENAIHRSKHILTVSNYTKSKILEHFGVKTNKITVIPNGVIPPREARSVSLTALGVYQPYFLYVGNAYPHKNIEMMMHAFSQFHENHPYAQLVIAGRRDFFSKRLEKEADELGLNSENVRFIDLPTDEELAALYKNASLFVFPSRIEGFGIPPLEAMSYGTPVAAANTSSIPEILKNAAQYFDPDDIEALVELMRQAADEPDRFTNLVKEGERLAESYTWHKTAKMTLEVYNNQSLL
ncbi:MAG: glycosyl transferase, group 1 [uncultured bacterium]|uniref:Glycosyl transferase, group 1 n=1 Tax=Candidatus Uhrbacteria bacterium GW2011_GWC1_41_20 TaxID=1618983 RepID=A0A0G0VFJ9_9BACT|nr:MAG: glycosyl transferase, group 1 [uncultured bacterium]KKR21963.1 MAG: glycosyl transferase, group 1 [Candidatus Uhrbacteria bacterium GW2011_GWE1_39_46]KKR63250.1 MAG: glycosyl transferase, group 1 [Candidatus Uhrbacteria bacterium GW2011_GWC2_40_450]KKR89477.1 MAG: glycosyl transferase, group 1 [Candidatus Uhrbacteria bacterium GW2011_GWE2_41_1153]KKR89558.1 MAG: glycosyl transferase, group 1 [Candidatus Uhrbacteria bacterium GW2011_GWD2_41_121]KKR94542.1 MAG: glycosyl transferase, grou